MSDDRSKVAALILSQQAEIIAILRRLEHQIAEIADDTDGIDRALRPYGDGTRVPPPRARRG